MASPEWVEEENRKSWNDVTGSKEIEESRAHKPGEQKSLAEGSPWPKQSQREHQSTGFLLTKGAVRKYAARTTKI